MNYEKIRNYCLIYFTLPVIIFFLGWLKPQFSIIGSLLLLFSLYKIIKRKNTSQNSIRISLKVILGLLLISMIWCFFAGQGGYFYQSADHGCRNAIFRDLINYKWPVIYEGTGSSALVYYIGYWMPAALVGKIALVVTNSQSIAWLVGNFALYLWSVCGVFLVFLLLITTVKATTWKKMILTSLLFIFFSGCDIIGYIVFQHTVDWHIEWWAKLYQYSSITTCLFWVFNQTVIAWIIILCLINEKNVRNFAFIGIMCIPFGPFPFIGILVYCIVLAIRFGINAIKQKKTYEFVKDIFSIQNMIACISVVPVYALYYSSNAAVNNGGGNLGIGGLYFFWMEIDSNLSVEIFRYCMFIILEVGFLAVLIYKRNKNNILFYISIFSLMVIPLFRMYGSGDFAMRASVPAITILGYMVIEYIINKYKDLESKRKSIRYTYILLITVYIIGSFTPLIEFGRGIGNVIVYEKINLVCDDIVTFDQKGRFENFTTKKYWNKPFYKYLAK